jgi:hypothetical protein
MSTHQMEQMVEQQTTATRLESSDEESTEDRRHKRRQREHGDDHDQPHGSSGTSWTTQDDMSPLDAASMELTHEENLVARC